MIFKLLALLTIVCSTLATIFTVQPSNYKINAQTTYTWRISFSPISTRNSLTFTFPTSVTVTASSTITYNGNTLVVNNFTSNSITFVGSSISTVSNVTISVSNVVNPASAVTATTEFMINSDFQTNLALINYNSVTYINDALDSCNWQFSLCTEQPSSTLTATVVTKNSIPVGTNHLLIGYQAVWGNHNSKGLMFQVTVFSCSISLDGGGTFQSVSCSNNAGSNLITITFTTLSTLNASLTIIAQIVGVQTPPTELTTTNSNYFISTTDSNNYLIDSLSSCQISPVCITTVTNGVFTTSSLTVNEILTDQQINFISYPIITVLPLDVIEIGYNPISNLNNCSTLRFWRNIINLKNLGPYASSNLSFVFPGDNFQIIDTNYPLYIYIACDAIVVPSSTTPTPITFHFMRSGSYYLQLTATINPQPATIDPTTLLLTLSNTEMANTNTIYTFNFNIGQPIGSNGAFIIGFHADINISSAICILKINSATVSSSCLTNNNELTVSVFTGAVIASGDRFQLIVSGLTNPSLPEMYNFTLATYYSANDSLSQVERASPAFNAIYTTITTAILTMTPNNLTVYTITNIDISIITPILIPAGSTLTYTFPSGITELSSSFQPLNVNTSSALLSNLSVITSNNTITFINLQSIASNSTLTLSVSLRTPSALGTYSYLSLSIINSVAYIQSLNTLSLVVAIPSSMPIAITASNPTTSAVTDYSFSISYTIPHPSTFTIQIDLPYDTSFVIAASTCSPNCSIASTNANGSQLTLTINNPNPNSTILHTQTYLITSFTNRRFVGSGTDITVSTLTSGNIVTTSAVTVDISSPNVLAGYLDSNVAYFKNNSAIVDIYLNLTTSPLQIGDYLLIAIDRTTYTATAITCVTILASCFVDSSSTVNVLVINVSPNTTTYTSNPLHIKIQGLTSGTTTTYFQTDYLAINLLSGQGLMETGVAPYQISCGFAAALPNQCKTCNSNGTCLSCYTQNGYYLNIDTCVTNCGNSTLFLRYADNVTSICEPCSGNCLSCLNSTACLSCLNSSYYLTTDSLTCTLTCPTSAGYIISSIGSQSTCTPCADPFCLQCNTTVYGTCTLCNNISALTNGICSSVCPNISYYIFNSLCFNCDQSCYTCDGASNLSCIRCASGYVNYSNTCTSKCPSGTAIIINLGICGCDSACLTCDSLNSVNCTLCANISHLVYYGQCISSCPNGSYQLSTSCLPCGTGCLSCDGNICFSCISGWYLYNGVCFSDCNLVSRQYDVLGGSCVLCPQGCDSCSGGLCASCLSEYTLSGSSCMADCLITSSCAVDSSKVLPLPGVIGVVLWIAAIIIIKFVWVTTFVPYGILFISSLIQFTLIISLAILTNESITGRLLQTLEIEQNKIILGLLSTSLGLNYFLNLIYVIMFIKYMVPLINKPKQSDYITHTIVLVIACLTNYRFGLLTYSHLCQKPRVDIDNSSRLTPIHYLCITTTIFDILIFIACGIGIYQHQSLTPIFMISLDLLIIVIINILVTVWFVVSTKPEQYYKYKTKYSIEQQNNTKQNITVSNEKDASKINIVMMDDGSQNYQRENINLGSTYKDVRGGIVKSRVGSRSGVYEERKKRRSNRDRKNDKFYLEESEVERNQNTINQKDLVINEIIDGDFQEQLPSKIYPQLNHSKVTSVGVTTHNKNNYHKQPHLNLSKIDKELYQNKQQLGRANIFQLSLQDEESQMPELQQKSVDGRFDINDYRKSQLIRLKKIQVESDKKRQNNGSSMFPSGIKNGRSQQSRKNSQEVHALRSNTEEKHLQEDDFQSIVMRKVLESNIRKLSQMNLRNQTEQNQDISPTHYNEANQRFTLDEDEEQTT